MPPRSIRADKEAWKRLADEVSRRMAELGLSLRAAALDPRGPSDSVWSIAANASQQKGTMLPMSLRGISVVLGWTPESAEAILSGGQPVMAPYPAEGPVASVTALPGPSRLDDIGDFVADLRRLEAKVAEVDGRQQRLEDDWRTERQIVAAAVTGLQAEMHRLSPADSRPERGRPANGPDQR